MAGCELWMGEPSRWRNEQKGVMGDLPVAIEAARSEKLEGSVVRFPLGASYR